MPHPHSALSSLRRPTRPRRVAVFALAWLLWLAATLGQMHGTLHGQELLQPLQPPLVAAQAVLHAASAQPTPATATRPGWRTVSEHGLAALFGDHKGGDIQCRLYDQVAGGPALPSIALMPPPPPVVPAFVFQFLVGEALARWVALFDARGPPPAR